MSEKLTLRTFTVEVTPPLGQYICGGMGEPAVEVLAPVWLRGLILATPGTRYVVAAVDYCYLIGRSQTRFEEALAEAAGIPPAQVILQSNHTHAAPCINEEAHAALKAACPEHDYHDEPYFADVLTRSAEAVRAALAGPGVELGGIAQASHPVRDFAATRRVLGADGRAQVRWSFCGNPAIKAAPVGKIDPLLDLITFYDTSAAPVACLVSYASHPQCGYIPGVIHGDTIGIAGDLFRQTHPGVFPVWFDGCGGDVTAGKYTTSNPRRDRLDFGVRLFDALEEAFHKSRPEPIGKLDWRDHRFPCPLAPVQIEEAELRRRMADPKADRMTKYLAVIKLERLRLGIETWPFRITRWQLGDICFVALPSELVVDYQLYAKSVYRGRLMVAAYGDSYLNYVGTAEMFAQGGYEVEPEWTEAGPATEAAIKQHLREVLTA